MLMEAVVTTVAGVMAHSSLLLAVGAASAVDFLSSCAVYYRFHVEMRSADGDRTSRFERGTARGVGFLLMLTAAHAIGVSGFRLWDDEAPVSHS